MFATRQDLLGRSNARRLAQLAVPADVAMVPLDAVRVALTGGSLSGFDAETQASLALAMHAIDNALGDADALLTSYSVPATATSPVLTRMACTVAMYYLQGAERLEKSDAQAYDGVIRLLNQHQRGEIDLVPAATGGTTTTTDDVAFIESSPGRYGVSRAGMSTTFDEVGL